MSAVADHYASCLAGNAKALAFVRDELILAPEQAAQQRIGFSDRSLGTQLPFKRVKSGREVREQLVSLGLYKKLSPQTRRFLNRLARYVSDTASETRIPRDSVRFTRRDIRQRLGWSDFQMRMHLTKLVELEYVLPHRGKNGQRYVYELLYDGGMPQSQPHFSGLIEPQELSESAGQNVGMTPTLSIAEATLRPA